MDSFNTLLHKSVKDTAGFWVDVASRLTWIKPWKKVMGLQNLWVSQPGGLYMSFANREDWILKREGNIGGEGIV